MTTFIISTDGNDDAKGTLDEPLASLGTALERASQHRDTDTEILFREGTYVLEKMVVIGKESMLLPGKTLTLKACGARRFSSVAAFLFRAGGPWPDVMVSGRRISRTSRKGKPACMRCMISRKVCCPAPLLIPPLRRDTKPPTNGAADFPPISVPPTRPGRICIFRRGLSSSGTTWRILKSTCLPSVRSWSII